MTWFRVDDSFYDHPKVKQLRAGRHYGDALALWLLAGTWCAKHLTGGILPKIHLKSAGFTPKIARELVRVGLWEEAGENYRFHKWSERQPTREQVEHRRKKTRERVDRWKAKQAPAERSENAPVTPLNGNCGAPGNAGLNSAPVPIRSEKKEVITEDIHTTSTTVGTSPHTTGVYVSPGDYGDFSAERMSVCFQRAYLAARKCAPAMGGKNIGEFHRRVVQTAAARGISPEKLFTEALSRFLAAEPSKIAQIAPYASFASAFDSLLEPDKKAVEAAEIAQMRESLQAQRKAGHNGAA